MYSIRMMLAIVGTLFVATLLAGCQSKELAACNEKNAFLERRVAEYEKVIEMREKDLKDKNDEVKRLTDTIAGNEERISILEKENRELHDKLIQTPEGAKAIIEGAAELKRLQQEAAEKLKKQQTPAESK